METRECPFCKEDIKSDAIKCKHCHSPVASQEPVHKGICPFCKEAIKETAIKCKNCQSYVGPTVIGSEGTFMENCIKFAVVDSTIRLSPAQIGERGTSPVIIESLGERIGVRETDPSVALSTKNTLVIPNPTARPCKFWICEKVRVCRIDPFQCTDGWICWCASLEA